MGPAHSWGAMMGNGGWCTSTRQPNLRVARRVKRLRLVTSRSRTRGTFAQARLAWSCSLQFQPIPYRVLKVIREGGFQKLRKTPPMEPLVEALIS